MKTFIDTSFYDGEVDWARVRQLCNQVIIRAGQGSWPDSMFQRNWAGAKLVGLKRSSYWYYDSRTPPKSQAERWVSYLGDDTGDMLFLDLEESYGGDYSGWRYWVEFLERLKELVPNDIGIYTAPYYWKDNTPNDEDLLYFAQYPLWIANYQVNNPTVPAPWRTWQYWQYTDKGDNSYYGVQNSSVDLNYSKDGGVEYFYDNTVRYTYGYKDTPRPFFYHCVMFPREVKRVHVNGYGFQGTAKYFYETREQPDIVINGGHGWYDRSPPVPMGYIISDGNIQKNDTDEVNIQWDDSHNVLGMAWAKLSGVYNCVGVSDVLLENGVVQPVDDMSVDPRTSLFWDDTHYYIVVIDGRNNGTKGLTRLELAEFAKSLGCKFGGNLDGGDSSALLINSILQNNPPEHYSGNPEQSLKAVVNHVGFSLDEGEVPPMDATHNVIKDVRVRLAPNFYASGVGDVYKGSTIESLDSVPDSKPAGTVPVMWEKIGSNRYVPNNHHSDPNIVYLEKIGAEPPEPEPVKVVHVIETYSDGTVTVDGIPFA